VEKKNYTKKKSDHREGPNRGRKVNGWGTKNRAFAQGESQKVPTKKKKKFDRGGEWSNWNGPPERVGPVGDCTKPPTTGDGIQFQEKDRRRKGGGKKAHSYERGRKKKETDKKMIVYQRNPCLGVRVLSVGAPMKKKEVQ